jgi:hypothetical protein
MTINTTTKAKKKHKKPYDSVIVTTGDIDLNIGRFNQAMGTDTATGTLQEAKRYVRRYYVRPMNVFCSNKSEIIKTLIDIGDQNCSVYTLNNLGDDKDVSKLMNSDIIYYYDDGILYDKNHVRIFDYDLSVKKEENRKHFTNVDKAPEKEFKAAYEDRMTSATELEEDFDDELFDTCPYDVISADYNDAGNKFIVSLNHNVSDIELAAEELIAWVEEAYGISIVDWNTNGSNVFIFELSPDNAFTLDFDDINVFGEKLTEAKGNFCCICGEEIEGRGHNPEPYMDSSEGVCCSGCHVKFVLPITEV